MANAPRAATDDWPFLYLVTPFIAPYYIVWGMIWIVEACAIVLAVSLLRTGIRGLSSR